MPLWRRLLLTPASRFDSCLIRQGMQTPRRKSKRIEVAVRFRKLDTPNQQRIGEPQR